MAPGSGAREQARENASKEAIAAVAAAFPGDGTATEALRRYIHAVVKVTGRYPFLMRETAPADQRRNPVLAGTFTALLKRGRRSGELRAEGSPEWWMRVLGGVVLASLDAIEEGVPEGDAAEFAASTFLRALSSG